MGFKWKVVPLCERQLRDVNPSDIIEGGLYRKCNIYKGGGGYDKFEEILCNRTGRERGLYNEQFVVQLYGCPLRCPYCYVTHDGIFGEPKLISTEELVNAFKATGLNVFHLMGGAPAMWMSWWDKILKELPNNVVFHSDFLCVENEYSYVDLYHISKYKNALYAVSVKGCDCEEFKKNTGRNLDEDLFFRNLEHLYNFSIPFYVTFTGMKADSIKKWMLKLKERNAEIYEYVRKDSFSIDVVQYEALS